MEELKRLLVERACTRLLVDYCRFVDFGNASRIAVLFTNEGIWEADNLVLNGPEAIRAHFLRREAVTRRVSRHLLTNIAIDIVSENEATGACYFANFRHDRHEGDHSLPVPMEVPKYLGEYRDRFRRTTDGWRFVHHKVDVAFVRQRDP